MKHCAIVLNLACLAAACGGSQKTAVAKGPTCAEGAAHTRELAMAGPGADAKIADLMAAVITERCVADAWSTEVITCMATGTQDEMAGCPAKLTDAQRDSFVEAVGKRLSEGSDEPPPVGESDNASGE